MESDQNTSKMQRCPYFKSCKAVKCPLDEIMDDRVKLSEDKEKCRLRKAKRLEIGRDMKTRGLTHNEIAALKRTYGSLEKGIRGILNRNINRKNKRKISKQETHHLNRND